MIFNHYLKKWAEGTPINKFFKNQFLIQSINYDTISFSEKEPTLMKRGLFKFSEFLWYAKGRIKLIVSEEKYMIIKFSYNSDIIYLNAFEEEVINKLKDLDNKKEILVVIKTRIPFSPKMQKFHELQYLRDG